MKNTIWIKLGIVTIKSEWVDETKDAVVLPSEVEISEKQNLHCKIENREYEMNYEGISFGGEIYTLKEVCRYNETLSYKALETVLANLEDRDAEISRLKSELANAKQQIVETKRVLGVANSDYPQMLISTGGISMQVTANMRKGIDEARRLKEKNQWGFFDNKINSIKCIRQFAMNNGFDLGLAESKTIVEYVMKEEKTPF